MSKVLIVEDEEAIAEIERDYLELSGFDVTMRFRQSGARVRQLPILDITRISHSPMRRLRIWRR